ncbi:hypothetical protein AMELA_G00033810 [Ameiurus melas]|uniref:Uncharacterized protein n=1 Tax=Ameiurus melas TaxID=219545 RepID=A0A7J6B9P7_AMEME|nr:hypothetical protein AMELA_G00033810 [Ameiurus melas]
MYQLQTHTHTHKIALKIAIKRETWKCSFQNRQGQFCALLRKLQVPQSPAGTLVRTQLSERLANGGCEGHSDDFVPCLAARFNRRCIYF